MCIQFLQGRILDEDTKNFILFGSQWLISSSSLPRALTHGKGGKQRHFLKTLGRNIGVVGRLCMQIRLKTISRSCSVERRIELGINDVL